VIRALLFSPRFLPCVMLALQAGAAARYAVARQTGPALYWVSAVGITYAVTFMMGAK
jgi:hypothetical protein